MIGFKFAKATKDRRLHAVNIHSLDMKQLKATIGKGKMYLIPRRKIIDSEVRIISLTK